MIKESALLSMITKCAAIGASIIGAVVAADPDFGENTEASIIFCALGLITYGTLRVFFINGYEKTRHVSPAKGAEGTPHRIQHQKYNF